MRPLARIAAVAVALISAGLIAGTAQAAVRAELAADVDPGPSSSRPSKLTAVGDSVYFYADGGPDRQGLWRTNGRLTQLVRPVGDPLNYYRYFWSIGFIYDMSRNTEIYADYLGRYTVDHVFEEGYNRHRVGAGVRVKF